MYPLFRTSAAAAGASGAINTLNNGISSQGTDDISYSFEQPILLNVAYEFHLPLEVSGILLVRPGEEGYSVTVLVCAVRSRRVQNHKRFV